MKHIFLYIYYTFSRWISKLNGYEVNSKSSCIDAHGLLSVFMTFNISTVVLYFVEKPYDKYICLIFMALIYVINMFFFNVKSLLKFSERWDKEPKNKRFFKRSLVLLYVLVSFTALFYVVWNR